MSLPESILTALFCMVVVFAILGMLSVILSLFSSMIRALEKTNDKSSAGANPKG